MATDGEEGDCPPEYRLFQAAKLIGCPPWELARRCEAWQEWAICFRKAEIDAVAIRAKIEKQRGEIAGENYED